ncbi:hypothetical protein HJC23_000037 [Cyclotella cryptica]|uniref:CHCH domain-containing protein n=1 Tax=Cyclotella cryptica TaxID=29204 RepID=A0ABD3P1Q3_9STRA|eukprot:CCRYP_018413-RA/>CCRYP_018413-RA protein AED:0.27 eAED:0.27 QI:0/-1/0/1/-1/1/1/0/123
MGQKQSSQPAIDGTNNASASQSESTPTSANVNIAAMIDSRANPPQEDARSHNFGQPIRPQSDAGAASKLITDCRVQQRASLQCIEENYENKDAACVHLFEDYKKCRREEHERKLELNARNSAW